MGRKCNDPQHRSEPPRPHGNRRAGPPRQVHAPGRSGAESALGIALGAFHSFESHRPALGQLMQARPKRSLGTGRTAGFGQFMRSRTGSLS